MIGALRLIEGGAAAAISASAGVLAYGVRVPSASILAPSVCRGVANRPAIALTFDDGPSESTPRLLEILAHSAAPATFFQCGANVRRLPDIARQVAAAGHEIGNHTDTHPMLHFKSRDYIDREVTAAQETIVRITGATPRFFRAPYGVRWFGLREVQRRLDLTGVMWTTLAMDWKRPLEQVISRLTREAANGAILCLHDGRALQSRPDIRVTLEAVRAVLPKLMEQGFHFEKVTDILCPTKN
jgi:peptidoglycan/xylan/chitin deacetylase (PgdA/CDA1 family)